MRTLIHVTLIAALTLLTQMGGVAWAVALLFRRRALAFLVAYLALSAAALVAAPQFGRVALSCWSEGPAQMRSWIFCALNRNYMTPEALAVIVDAGADLRTRYPGTTLRVLDAGFPFFDGFPLLPHLSHGDGQKADLALFYERDGTFADGFTPSPVGYFAFEDGPTDCALRWPTLRWDLAWLQPLWPEARLEPNRTAALVRHLAGDPRVSKILLEPHLAARLGVAGGKVRFQGCRAARHDDHIHIQI